MNNLTSLTAVLVLGCSALGLAADKSMMNESPMSPKMNIVENASKSPDFSALVAAVKAAGLVDTLSGAGPFTVFAPTNEALQKLPAGTVDTLVKPENEDQLSKILTFHVIAGEIDAAKLTKAITAGGGKASLKTVNGEELTAMMEGNGISLTGAKGGTAKVSAVNLYQSNGVTHVIDSVSMP